MRVVCPCCQTDFPLEAGIHDVAGRKAAALISGLTPYGNLFVEYINLFKPKQRALSWSRFYRILLELVPMIEAGKIEYKGRVFPAPQDYWRMALEQMIDQRDTLTLPLKSHGYLLTIIAGAADKADKKVEAQQEMRKRTSHTQQEQDAAIRKGMPEAVRNQLQEIINKNNL